MFFPYIGNFIIPTDEVIFFRGVGQLPTSNGLYSFGWFNKANRGISMDLPSDFIKHGLGRLELIYNVRPPSYKLVYKPQ